MMSWSACLLRSVTDPLGPHQSARPAASYTIRWDSIFGADGRPVDVRHVTTLYTILQDPTTRPVRAKVSSRCGEVNRTKVTNCGRMKSRCHPSAPRRRRGGQRKRLGRDVNGDQPARKSPSKAISASLASVGAWPTPANSCRRGFGPRPVMRLATGLGSTSESAPRRSRVRAVTPS